MPEPDSRAPHENAVLDRLDELCRRLDRIEAALETLLSQQVQKDWYTTDEVAEILDKAPFTVREWCRLGRVDADKRASGRGSTQEWIISHEELQRIRNHGLLPLPTLRCFD